MQNQEFLIYRLTHASQETVYSWLEDNQPRQDESIFSSDREELESSLLSRDEPLVKLGLALFGYEQKTGLELYKDSDDLIKKAVLSGTTIRSCIGDNWIVSEGILSELLDSKRSPLLGNLLSNPSIDDNLLVNLYGKEKSFEKLDDKFWLELVAQTLSNPRLSTPYDEAWMDGWDEYSYSRVFSAGWKLFEKLPVNDKSAVLLSRLGERMVPDKPHDMEVTKVIERWKKDNTDKIVDCYSLCRTSLSNLISDFETEFKELKESKDIALRQSYYRRFSPLKKEEVRELFERDNDKFLNDALENKKLYRKEDIRDELRQCCWDYKDPHHDILYPNIFNSRVEQLSKEFPEWFEDWDGEIPIDAIEDPVERTNKQLSHVGRKINEISKKILEAGDEENPLFEEVRDGLNNIAVYLHDLKNSPSYGWAWVIVGSLVGYVVAR